MKAYTLDTHILLWHLTGQRRKLGRAAQRAFAEAERGDALLYVSTISLIELWDLNQRSGGLFDFGAVVRQLLRAAQFVFVPFEAEDVFLYDQLARIPEGRDRLIAIVSRKLEAPLITVDSASIACGVVTIAA